jgi:membrane-bound ClpP family serine protease
MHPNEGIVDRIIRLILGVAALILAFLPLDAGSGAAGGIALAVVGALLVLTAATGHCLLYNLFKFSTTK